MPTLSSPPPDESLILSLGAYEGPLDLLLGLARQKRVDLKHISIATLAQQYLEFIARAQRLHLAVKAEYLVMAAHLARMKARMLLPRDKSAGEQAEKSAETLRENLLWLESARQTARFLRTLPRLGSQIFTRGCVQEALPESIVSWELDTTLFELLQSYVAIERRRERQAKRLRICARRLYDLQDARTALMAQLDKQWRDLLCMIPASVHRQAEKEDNPRLFLKSVISGFFAVALELANNNGRATPPTRKVQSQPSENRNENELAYAELYQPSFESPLQLRLRREFPFASRMEEERV